MHVGRRMKQRREALGISQGQLGRLLGLTFSQVQKYEKGTNRIGAGRLHLLSGFLKVPVHFFFEGLEDEVRPYLGNASSDQRRELSVLENAFLSIDDAETRESIVALICSLAPNDPRRPGARRDGAAFSMPGLHAR